MQQYEPAQKVIDNTLISDFLFGERSESYFLSGGQEGNGSCVSGALRPLYYFSYVRITGSKGHACSCKKIWPEYKQLAILKCFVFFVNRKKYA